MNSHDSLKNLKNFLVISLCVWMLMAGVCVLPIQGSTPPQEGSKAVTFALQNLNDQTVKSEELQGKVTVILFGCKGLPLTRESVGQIQRVADKHPNINVLLVLTNSLRPKDSTYASDEELRTLVETNHLHVPVLRDPGGELLFKRLSLRVLPSLIILNRKGELAAAAREGLDPNVNLASQLTWEIEKAQ